MRKTGPQLEKQRLDRCKKREKKALTGTNFIADTPHEAFSSPNVFRRRVNMYFSLREEDKRPQTLPGLCLFLGLRTKALNNYDPGPELEEYRRIADYAIQRVEEFTVEHLFTTKGSTKGIEFLAQNSLGYANKSDVNSKTALELTEREKLKQMPEEQLRTRVGSVLDKLNNVVGFPGAKSG